MLTTEPRSPIQPGERAPDSSLPAVDPDGIVRWSNVEYATEGPAAFGKFPTVDELLVAARALA